MPTLELKPTRKLVHHCFTGVAIADFSPYLRRTRDLLFPGLLLGQVELSAANTKERQT